jgi:DNA invertase Pin-like site-specific DNA recombinase
MRRASDRAWLRLTPEQVRKLCAEYKGGVALRQLGAKWGCSGQTVCRVLAKAGVERRPLGRPAFSAYSPAEARQMQKQYKAGQTLAELAEQYDCSRQTVHRVLKQSGVKLRPLGRRELTLSPAEERDMRKAYLAGGTLNELAAKQGWSRQKVGRLLHKAGVKLRSPGRRTLEEAARAETRKRKK